MIHLPKLTDELKLGLSNYLVQCQDNGQGYISIFHELHKWISVFESN